MDHLINHLVQLQELTLIRDEQKAADHTAHLEQLDGSIRSMIKGLPEGERELYNKLFKKDHTVIVPLTDDNCTGCGMKLPISLIQIVRQGKTVESCPNCARMLYCAVEAPRRVAKRERRTAPPKVGMTTPMSLHPLSSCSRAMAARAVKSPRSTTSISIASERRSPIFAKSASRMCSRIRGR